MAAVLRLEVGVGAGEHDEDVLRRVIEQVYDVTADDARLREIPADFDRLRAEYPIRREFFNTELVLEGGSEELLRSLTIL